MSAKSAQIERTKLTPPELARSWGLSPAKVVAFIRSGELRAINIANAGCSRPRYLVDREDIAVFEQARRVIPDGGSSTAPRLRRKSSSNIKEFC